MSHAGQEFSLEVQTLFRRMREAHGLTPGEAADALLIQAQAIALEGHLERARMVPRDAWPPESHMREGAGET